MNGLVKEGAPRQKPLPSMQIQMGFLQQHYGAKRGEESTSGANWQDFGRQQFQKQRK